MTKGILLPIAAILNRGFTPASAISGLIIPFAGPPSDLPG
jgi:hypothetical protein